MRAFASQVAARELGFHQLTERLEAMRLRRAKDPLEHVIKCPSASWCDGPLAGSPGSQ